MKFKEFFKPTKRKIIVSIIVPVLLFIFKKATAPLCKMCAELNYGNWPTLIPSCNCTIGSTFPEFIIQAILIFILPFIITYIIYSLIEKKK